MPRWLTIAIWLLALATFVNYVDRGNLSTAAPLIKSEFRISATTLGLLLTSFFLTYSSIQLLTGWLVDRFNVSWVLLSGFVVWSLATTFTGFAQTLAALFVLRLVLGAAESIIFPAIAKVFAGWVPQIRLGAANGAIYVGMALGPAFGVFVGGLLMAAYGWRWFFIAFGLAGLLWIVPWMACVHKRLESGAQKSELPKPDIGLVLRQRSLWAATAAQFGTNYLWYFIITWLPSYLVLGRHHSLTQMSVIGGAAYLATALSMLVSGFLGDRWIAAGATPTLARKTILGFGCLIGGGFAIVCGAVQSPELSALYLIAACAGIGMISPSMFSIVQTMAGPYACGRWIGIQNGLANFGGVAAPALTGVLVDRTGYFILPFTIAGLFAVCSAFIWVFVVGPVVPIDWSGRESFITAPETAATT